MVLDGPNVDSKSPRAARRASGMRWGPRSEGCAPEKYPSRKFGIFPPLVMYLAILPYSSHLESIGATPSVTTVGRHVRADRLAQAS